MTAEEDIRHLLLSLLQGFYWCDEGLQNYLRARGWPSVTRPQSMIMANVALGVRRPSDIARRLGVSRQAIHSTISHMVDLGIVELVEDPTDGRMKILATTAKGDAMRADAQQAMKLMGQALFERLGKANVLKAAHLLHEDWGPPLSFDEPGG